MQKTAYEMRISDWSSDVCSSDLIRGLQAGVAAQVEGVVEAVERSFRYRPMLRVAIGDDSNATLVLRFFHFRAAQVAQFAPGARVRCYGTPRLGQHGLEIVHPSYRGVGTDEAGGLGDSLVRKSTR